MTINLFNTETRQVEAIEARLYMPPNAVINSHKIMLSLEDADFLVLDADKYIVSYIID